MTSFSTADIAWNLIVATRWTIVLSLIALVGGAFLGAVLLAMRLADLAALRLTATVLVTVVQGTPLLIQLFLTFFGLSAVGLDVSAWFAAALALILWTGAFLSDIWRGCVEAVGRGQWEASASLAMSWRQQMRHVIVPQAIRIAIPATVGFSVQVVKGTALTSIIGFVELTRTAAFISNATYRPLATYAIVASVYFGLCWPLSLGAALLGRRLDVAHRAS